VGELRQRGTSARRGDGGGTALGFEGGREWEGEGAEVTGGTYRAAAASWRARPGWKAGAIRGRDHGSAVARARRGVDEADQRARLVSEGRTTRSAGVLGCAREWRGSGPCAGSERAEWGVSGSWAAGKGEGGLGRCWVDLGRVLGLGYGFLFYFFFFSISNSNKV